MTRLDPATGDSDNIFNCGDWLDDIGGWDPWCESNTVNYVESHHTVLYSFYTNDTVVEMDADSGEVVRQFGDLPDSYDFTVPGTEIAWQHGVNYTYDDHLLMSTHQVPDRGEQRAREYVVDDGARTATQVWEYGEGTGKYASTAGEIYRLDNGNYIMNYGSSAGIREIEADGNIVWDVDWSGSKLMGHTSFIGDVSALYRLQGPAE